MGRLSQIPEINDKVIFLGEGYMYGCKGVITGGDAFIDNSTIIWSNPNRAKMYEIDFIINYTEPLGSERSVKSVRCCANNFYIV